VGGIDAGHYFSLKCAISATRNINKKEYRELLNDASFLNTKNAPSLFYVKVGTKVRVSCVCILSAASRANALISMTSAESLCSLSLSAQGKKIPMVSGRDLVRLFKRLQKREKAQGTVSKVKPVPGAQPDADANAAEGAAGSIVQIADVQGVPNHAAGDGGFSNASTSPQRMPPPRFTVAAANYNYMTSKKLCDITQFPEFAMKSHRSVGFRQRDEKVSAPDLLVVVGKYKMVYEAHNAILKMVENKDAMLDGLDSLEIHDNLIMLRGKSVILLSFPDAIKLLHRLGVCTIDKDAVVPPIEMAVTSDPVQGVVMPQNAMAAVSDVIPQVQVAVSSETAQGLAMPKVTVSVASGATQGLVMPNITVSIASEVAQRVATPQAAISTPSKAAHSNAVKNRIRMRKISGPVFKTISGLQDISDSCLEDKVVRQVEPGQVDEKGENIGGRWVITDGVSACTGDSAETCARWVKNPKNVNKEIAKSFSYIDSGNSSVSLLKVD